MKMIDERISRISFSETSDVRSADASMQTTVPSLLQEQPSAESILHAASQSDSLGQL